MKKLILLLFLILGWYADSQKYTFDHVLTYDCSTKIPSSTIKHNFHIAVNSSNPNYVFHIRINGFGTLENYKTNEKHSFSTKVMEDGGLDSNYLKTYKIAENKESYYYNSKLDDSGVFQFQIFKNRKKTKVKNEVEIKLKEAPYNLLYVEGDHFYKEKKILLSQLKSSLDSTRSYIMESETIHHSNGYIFTCNYIRSEKFKIDLTIPFSR